MSETIALTAFTARGRELASKLAASLGGSVRGNEPLADWTKKSFVRFAKENGLEVERIVGIRKQLKFMPNLLSHSYFIPFQYGFLTKLKK